MTSRVQKSSIMAIYCFKSLIFKATFLNNVMPYM